MKGKPVAKPVKKVPPRKTPEKKSSGMAVMTPTDKAHHDKWQAEDDVRTLQRAGEIERDKARLARAKATAKKQADDLARITQGRK